MRRRVPEALRIVRERHSMTNQDREATKGEPKDGLLTTEFWLAAGAMIAATVALAFGGIPADTWEKVVGAAVIGYPIGRGLAKQGG